MRDSKRNVSLVAGVCALAFLLRIGMWYYDAAALNQDIDAYLEIARHLAQGEGFARGPTAQPTAYRPPLYPLLIAGIFRCGGTPWFLGGVQVILGTLTTALTWRCGQLLKLGSGSLIAAGLVALDPLLIRYTTVAMTETFCATLVMVWCWLVLEFPLGSRASTKVGVSSREGEAPTEPNTTAGRRPPEALDNASGGRRANARHWLSGSFALPIPAILDAPAISDDLIARERSCTDSRMLAVRGVIQGMSFGLICLCRPAFLAAVGIATFWVIGTILYKRFCHRANPPTLPDCGSDPRGLRLIPMLGCLVGLSAVLAPWMIRNAILLGKPTPATTHGGYTVLLANNPTFYRDVLDGPRGAVWTEKSLRQWQAELEVELLQAGIPESDEVARDKWMYGRAKSIMLADPVTFFRACVYRSGCFWALAPARKANDLGAIVSWAITIFYGFVSLGLILGLWRILRSNWDCWLPLLLLPLTLWLTHLVYWTDTRMRAPVIPILALVAASGFDLKRNHHQICSRNDQS